MAVNRDDERETDRCFRGRDGDGKDGDHHAGRILLRGAETPERDEIQIRGSKHELDPDEDEDGVTTAKRGEQADREEGGGNDQAEWEGEGHGVSVIGERERLARWFWR